MNNIRQPKQARSIQTKNKILLAGYELFEEVGYYGTNTAQIAQKAGVSTGIVYGYFHDKRDILISILDQYISDVTAPIFEVFDSINGLDYLKLVPMVIDSAIAMHKEKSKMHEVLHSLTSVDEKVRKAFIDQEDTITRAFTEKLVSLGENKEGLSEKVHVAMNLVQSFCHESIFDQHDYLNYEYMKNLVSEMVISLFK